MSERPFLYWLLVLVGVIGILFSYVQAFYLFKESVPMGLLGLLQSTIYMALLIALNWIIEALSCIMEGQAAIKRKIDSLEQKQSAKVNS